jgi:hypothetical protein
VVTESWFLFTHFIPLRVAILAPGCGRIGRLDVALGERRLGAGEGSLGLGGMGFRMRDAGPGCAGGAAKVPRSALMSFQQADAFLAGADLCVGRHNLSSNT